MIDLDVYNELGEVTGQVKLDESLLGDQIRPRLMHQVVVAYMANQRQGTKAGKSKSEVAGSGHKPWKQKHTGRARAGSKRPPHWRGGGRAFAAKPRDYRQHTPKAMRREALRSALLSKLRDNEIVVIESPVYDEPKTKRVAETLRALKVDSSCLIATREPNPLFFKSTRNIQKLRMLPARNLNAFEVLGRKQLILTRDVVENLAEVVR